MGRSKSWARMLSQKQQGLGNRLQLSRRKATLSDHSHHGTTSTTHYIDEAEILSDNVAVINTGTLVTCGSPRELLSKVDERVRVDVTGDRFTEDDLAHYGRPVRIAERWRVLTDNKRAGELTIEAVRRNCDVSVSPVSLEDLFVDLVGGEEENATMSGDQK